MYQILRRRFNNPQDVDWIGDDMPDAGMRRRVIYEAWSWLGTPYHKNGRTKRLAADCATFLFCVLQNCGLIPAGEEGIFNDPKIVPYAQDWWCNTDERKYAIAMLRYAKEVLEEISVPRTKAQPGDMVLINAMSDKIETHGAIVIKWPLVIHCVPPAVRLDDATQHWLMQGRKVTVFDPYANARS